MKYINALMICCITFLTACGGSDSPTGNENPPAGSTSPAGNAASPTGNTTPPTGNVNSPSIVASPAIDGPKKKLLSDEDGFISTESDHMSLRDVEAPITQDFTAAKQQQITISSRNGDSCHINIYTRYNKKGPIFTPSGGGRILQTYSDSCEYTGDLYLLNQQRKLLVEIINLNEQDTTTYYEKTITPSGIKVKI